MYRMVNIKKESKEGKIPRLFTRNSKAGASTKRVFPVSYVFLEPEPDER